MREQANQSWLVKSGDRILGPFSTEEIEQKLRSKEIVLIDEVVSPLGRWRYLRDEVTFALVTEEIRRGLMSAREDTEVQSGTQTQTETDPGTELHAELLRDDSTASRVQAMDAKTVREAEVVSEVRNVRPSNTSAVSSSASSAPVRKYGVGDQSSVQKKVSLFSAVMWTVAVLAVGIAGYFLSQGILDPGRSKQNQMSSAERAAELKEQTSRATQAWEIGDFPRALRAYRFINQLGPGSFESVVREALLTMKLEGQTLIAKRAFEKVLNGNPEQERVQEAKMGLGIAALLDDDFTEAERRFLEASLDGPLASSAQFNAGVAAYLSRSYQSAMRLFVDSKNEPLAVLMQVKTALAMRGPEGTQAQKDVSDKLNRFIDSSADFRQEAQVLAAYLALESGDRKQALILAKGALESDPFLTSEHYHTPFLHLQPLQWSSLLPLCRDLNEKLKAPVTRSLFAICLELSGAGQREVATQLITDALAASPEEPSLHAANAFILLSSGRGEEARASLRLASKGEPLALVSILQARACAELKDNACAEAEWSKLMDGSPGNPAALTGVALVKRAQGASDQATDLIRRALVISPRYLPAIKILQGLQ